MRFIANERSSRISHNSQRWYGVSFISEYTIDLMYEVMAMFEFFQSENRASSGARTINKHVYSAVIHMGRHTV